MSMFDLSGRVAVVTGTAQGMGRAMATAFAEAGANLLLLDRNQEGNDATAHALAQMGCKVVPMACDVANLEQLDRVFDIVDKEFGRLDILGNVAGEAHVGPAEDMTIEHVQQTFHNLVISRFYCTQQAGRRMLHRGKGSIMSIGSIAGVSSLGRTQAVYGMAMAAVIHMTKELSTEWSGRGVRVNAILPAQVLNSGLEMRMQADPYLRDTFLYGIPRGRFGHPDDIKGLAVWLASDAADWITGAIIPMDGGNLAKNGGGGLMAPIIEKHVAARL
ncbi:MAG: SDR family oxidoreductase [Chloroflexi bacterium]|nr:MAG: SDR family oxidoreductase [Chloroflexota bacterium]